MGGAIRGSFSPRLRTVGAGSRRFGRDVPAGGAKVRFRQPISVRLGRYLGGRLPSRAERGGLAMAVRRAGWAWRGTLISPSFIPAAAC